jgi:ubiquitin carboxyl-terminal hydrolase 14
MKEETKQEETKGADEK